jgi:hypothetical protein
MGARRVLSTERASVKAFRPPANPPRRSIVPEPKVVRRERVLVTESAEVRASSR